MLPLHTDMTAPAKKNNIERVLYFQKDLCRYMRHRSIMGHGNKIFGDFAMTPDKSRSEMLTGANQKIKHFHETHDVNHGCTLAL